MEATYTTPIAPTKSDARRRLLKGLPVYERAITCNGIDTAFLEGGSGRPVVLLHGPGEHAAKWFRVVPDLAQSYRLVMPDLPAHGRTGTGVEPLDTERVMGWLRDLIEKTCSQPPVLVGQIIGGAVAARFAARFGEDLSGLVLVDSLGLAPFQPAPEFGHALMDFIHDPTEDKHDRLWERCAYDLDALRQRIGGGWDDLRAYNLELARKTELKPAQGLLMEQFGFPPIPETELSRITVPTSLIWGRHDLATSLGVAEEASARFGWPLTVIEGAADDPAIEQTEAFLQALRKILNAL